jgi:hypothetical protein
LVPVTELGARSRPTRIEAARDVEVVSLPLPWPDLVRILNPRPRPVVADSDPLALVYPGADSDALSLPEVNLNEGERGADDVDTANLRTLDAGDLESEESGA